MPLLTLLSIMLASPTRGAAPILQLVEHPGVLLRDDRKLLFGLYADGTVIYASPRSAWTRDRGHPVPAYFRAKLTPEEKDKLLAQLDPSQYVRVLARDLLPGEPPASFRCKD